MREQLRLVGRVTLPLTQQQLGEARRPSVHTDRILRELRLIAMLELQHGTNPQ